MRLLRDRRVIEGLPARAEALRRALAPLAHHPHVGEVRQRGLMVGIELVRDRATKQPYPWEEKRGMRVCDFARGRGVWIRPLGNVIVIMPPLAISLEEIDAIADAVERGFAACE